MKKIFLTMLLLSVILTAGCTGGSKQVIGSELEDGLEYVKVPKHIDLRCHNICFHNFPYRNENYPLYYSFEYDERNKEFTCTCLDTDKESVEYQDTIPYDLNDKFEVPTQAEAPEYIEVRCNAFCTRQAILADYITMSFDSNTTVFNCYCIDEYDVLIKQTNFTT